MRRLARARAVQLVLLAAVLGLLGALIIAPARSQIASSSPNVSDRLVPLHGAWWGDYAGPNPADVLARESLAGRRFDIVHFYEDMNGTFPSGAQAALTPARFLFFNVQPRIFGGSSFCWRSITNGSHDAWLKGEAGALRSFGRRLFISFSHEPEGNDGTACDTARGIYGTDADFVAAFRHVHNVMGTIAPNIVWVMNYANPGGTLAAKLYPGNAYVDWIAWDPYNWYACGGHHDPWTQLAAKMSGFYTWARANHPDKALMLAETGSAQPSGTSPSKGRWFRNIPAAWAKLPAAKALVYFDRRSNGDCIWKVDSSADSLAGWRAAGASSYFHQPHS